jgi:hypothetical protein
LLARLAVTLSLGIAVCLALATSFSVPEGLGAARLIAAPDDPVRLSELGLNDRFDAAAATQEIEQALAKGDVELARSFVDLAAERGLAVPRALIEKTEQTERDTAAPSSHAASFAKGFVTGKPEDVASAAGMLTGDLFVFGDIRDAVREGWHGLRGEEVDKVVLGLAGTGIAITAGMYATGGLAAPARAGVSVAKAARRGGYFGVGLIRLLKVETREGLVQFVRNLGRVQSQAGMRGAFDALKIAQHPQDAAKLARLAEAKGTKTRAIVKLLGRGAILLTGALFDLALWVFWALLNLLAFCAACKRAVERMTLRHCERRRMRKRRLAEAAAAA